MLDYESDLFSKGASSVTGYFPDATWYNAYDVSNPVVFFLEIVTEFSDLGSQVGACACGIFLKSRGTVSFSFIRNPLQPSIFRHREQNYNTKALVDNNTPWIAQCCGIRLFISGEARSFLHKNLRSLLLKGIREHSFFSSGRGAGGIPLAIQYNCCGPPPVVE
jgi:hypothetical protein